MGKRSDLQSILIIGSGPIVIGQACEFDYSGTQACKALREEGYRIILVNSNPATIMTDPEFADATYVEPLTVAVLAKIIAKERPDALLPTLGGQTGLNLSLALAEAGILERYGVELIGAKQDAIQRGENRELFRKIMLDIGLDVPQACIVKSIPDIQASCDRLGSFPLIIRPSFTLGGRGGGIAYNREEFETMAEQGLSISPVHEVLVEECLLGWKEYEMEVVRDAKDQCLVICAIENIDPMGVHTGDSITVAPAMTLSDKEYQLMRDASFAVIRAIGVDTGGSNIQFAVNPTNGRLVVIEMNPRVSRSSALASKATGFPIAKIAAKLAVGYTLDELKNDVTRDTTACFEPSIDYVVTKIPRFTFEKFPDTDPTLTSCMKSIGETMAIGRTFKESLQKALRSLENGIHGFACPERLDSHELPDRATITANLSKPTSNRIHFVRYAFLRDFTVDEVHQFSHIDRWFLRQLQELVVIEKELRIHSAATLPASILQEAQEAGFSDLQIANLVGQCSPKEVSQLRRKYKLPTLFRQVDTCAAEFPAQTPYFYSSHGANNEVNPSTKPKIMILGGGPNRIGQGIEFDYCCVHASFALRAAGFETIMVNSNPETVSTDYDTSDRLYFEPLTLESVLEIYHQEQCTGAIVQFGGQTPLNLASALKQEGVNIIGTAPEQINAAEDRQTFKAILDQVGLKQPRNCIALSEQEALDKADDIGFPILLRPSFVLGGRGMFIVYSQQELVQVAAMAFAAAPGKPVLLDKFLEDAIELDVDCIADGETTVIGGILEHIEPAGVHSGDAGMVLPPHTISPLMVSRVRAATQKLANALQVVGLMNVQYAVKKDELYVIEVNPRASRTIPFVSKVINVPLAKLAARVMAGEKLQSLGFTQEVTPPYWAIKESVFPFVRFPGSRIMLSPEMRSTGEVMGVDKDLGIAFAKSQMAAYSPLPHRGNIFISVKDADKPLAIEYARGLTDLGFTIYSTAGTASALQRAGIAAKTLFKISEGARPNVADMIKNDEIQLVINTPTGSLPRIDENAIRTIAIDHKVCMITTLSGVKMAIQGMHALRRVDIEVTSLQEYAKTLQSAQCE